MYTRKIRMSAKYTLYYLYQRIAEVAKKIDLGMGDTCYPNFVPFTMYEFERNIYLYCFNGINPYPRVETNFKPRSSNTVQVNYFLHNEFVKNTVRQHKEFKYFFV